MFSSVCTHRTKARLCIVFADEMYAIVAIAIYSNLMTDFFGTGTYILEAASNPEETIHEPPSFRLAFRRDDDDAKTRMVWRMEENPWPHFQTCGPARSPAVLWWPFTRKLRK